MCLIKIGDPLSPCEHQECRTALEAFKISHCQYNNIDRVQNLPFMNQKFSKTSPSQYSSEISQEIIKKLKIDKDDYENCESLKKFMKPGFFPHQQNYNYAAQNNLPQNYNNLMPNFFPNQQIVHQASNFHPNNNNNEALLNLQLKMSCNPQRLMQANNSLQPPQEKDQISFSEVERQIWSTLIHQNSILLEMREKSNFLASSMEKIVKDFNEMQKNMSFLMNCESKPLQQAMPDPKISFSKYTVSTPEIENPDDLINYLYLNKPKNFEYKLVLNNPLDFPLYRERNFSFSVTLKDNQNKEIFHTNRIPLSLAVYTYENPSKCVESNTSGQKIIKGSSEKDLVNGVCLFEKIQIREVTSHFRKGKVFLVVYPKMPTFGAIPQENIMNSFVDYTQIKPLIIESVIVKAKKIPSFMKKIKKRPKMEKFKSADTSEKVSIFEETSDI